VIVKFERGNGIKCEEGAEKKSEWVEIFREKNRTEK
jgi:hypothetical protein